MAIVDELIAVLGYDVRGEAELKRFNQSLDALERKAFAVGAAIGKIGAIAGTAAAAGFAFLGNSVAKTGNQFHQYEIQLETLLGSSEKAQEALAWIQQFAKDTPLGLAETTQAYASLVNYGLEPTNGTLQAIVDAMAATGKGTETVRRLTLALGQAWTKQKLQGQEILQLTEAGIPVWDMLAQATGKQVAELQDLSSAGKLGRKEIQLLIDAIGKKYVGASEKFAKTLDGTTSKLGDVWTDFQKRIADAGFYDTLISKLHGLLDVLDEFDRNGTLDRLAKTLSGALTTGADALGVVIERVGQHVLFLMENFEQIEPWLTAFGIALLGLAAYAFPVLAAVAALALAVDDFLTYLEGGESIIGSFLEAFQRIPETLRTVDFRAMGEQVGQSMVEGLKSAFLGTGTNDWFYIKVNPDKARESMQLLYDAMIAVSDIFVGVGTAIVDAIYNGLVAAAGKIKGAIQSLIPGSWATGMASPADTRAAAAAAANAGGGSIENMLGNMSKMNGDQAAPVAVDNSTKTNSVTTNVQAPVTVNVQQATQAPAAVGNAVQGAVNRGAQPSRMQSGPAL